jgi:hypothetical protein
LPLNILHDARLRDVQHIVILTQIFGMIQELRAPERRFLQALRLEHGAHGAIQDHDPLFEQIMERSNSVISIQRSSPDPTSGPESLSLPWSCVSIAANVSV